MRSLLLAPNPRKRIIRPLTELHQKSSLAPSQAPLMSGWTPRGAPAGLRSTLIIRERQLPGRDFDLSNGCSGPHPDGQAPETRRSAPMTGFDPDPPVANGRFGAAIFVASLT